MMSRLFPWTMLADAFLLSLLRVRLPMMLGYVVVCERYVLDMLIDLALALDDPSLWQRYPGRLFFTLLPPRARVVVLDLDPATIYQRRPELRQDRSLVSKRERYLQLARENKLAIMSTELDARTLVEEMIAAERDEEFA
jgi:hypothetical protein